MARHALITREHAPSQETRRDTSGDTVAVRAPVTAYDRFGGTNWGACFFGWLVAVGVLALLGALVAVAVLGVATLQGWTQRGVDDHARSLALGGAIAAGVLAFVAGYAGGYVAGRMSRFDGLRQGVGVWLITVLTAVIAGGLVALVQARSHLLPSLDLARGDLTAGEVAVGAAATGVAALVLMLLGSVAGGALGRRYHRRVDAAR